MQSADGAALILLMAATVVIVGGMSAMPRGLPVAGRQARLSLQSSAASAERRRIAWEIDDVVTQSFTVMLLHLTEARRVLEETGDIGTAVGEVLDAERLGRHAMADVRRTIRAIDAFPSQSAQPAQAA